MWGLSSRRRGRPGGGRAYLSGRQAGSWRVSSELCEGPQECGGFRAGQQETSGALGWVCLPSTPRSLLLLLCLLLLPLPRLPRAKAGYVFHFFLPLLTVLTRLPNSACLMGPGAAACTHSWSARAGRVHRNHLEPPPRCSEGT